MTITQKLEDVLVAVKTDIMRAGRMMSDPSALQMMQWKKTDDPVTNLDREVEELFRQTAERHAIGLIGEEFGRYMPSGAIQLIVDPLDGTKSFVTGEYNSAISVAVTVDGSLRAGYVYDFMRDVFYGGEDERRFLVVKGKEVQPRNSLLQKARVVANSSVIRKCAHMPMNGFHYVQQQGSIALSMAQVAFGTYDGFLIAHEGKGNVWDIAAGVYLLQCAGFAVTNLEGRPIDMYAKNSDICAMPPKLDFLREAIRT